MKAKDPFLFLLVQIPQQSQPTSPNSPQCRLNTEPNYPGMPLLRCTPRNGQDRIQTLYAEQTLLDSDCRPPVSTLGRWRTVRWPSAQLFRHLLHGAAEKAELVAFWVGEDHPGHIWPLADVDALSAETFEPFDLGSEAGPISSHVEVHSVLDLLGLWHWEDVKQREVSVWRRQADALVAFFNDFPSKHCSPETGYRTEIDSIEAH